MMWETLYMIWDTLIWYGTPYMIWDTLIYNMGHLIWYGPPCLWYGTPCLWYGTPWYDVGHPVYDMGHLIYDTGHPDMIWATLYMIWDTLYMIWDTLIWCGTPCIWYGTPCIWITCLAVDLQITQYLSRAMDKIEREDMKTAIHDVDFTILQKSVKKLSFFSKHNFFYPYIFAIGKYKALLFQTSIIWSDRIHNI